jgi:hypothetical protein
MGSVATFIVADFRLLMMAPSIAPEPCAPVAISDSRRAIQPAGAVAGSGELHFQRRG